MKKLRLKGHVTWLMINLRSGADNHESGYKTCTSTTSQILVLCLELDLDQVIYVLEQVVKHISLSYYYPIIIIILQKRKQLRFRGVVSNIHSPSELHDKF